MAQFREFYLEGNHLNGLDSFQTLKKQSQNLFQEKKHSKTRLPELQSQVFQSRSKKNSNQLTEDVSFENTMLDNHFLAFKQIFNKYWQKINNNLYFNHYKYQEYIILTISNFNYKEWIQDQLRRNQKLSNNKKNQIIEDWKNQQNLSKFLRLITQALQQELNSQLNDEIIYLTSLIWQQYIKFSNSKFSDDQKIKMISSFLGHNNQNIFLMDQFQLLTFASSEKNKVCIKNGFNQFLTSYTEIIYLVLEGYFDNPLLSEKSEDSFHRPSDRNIEWSDFEDFQDFHVKGLPRKMPKLS